jgi:hypothetical protein
MCCPLMSVYTVHPFAIYSLFNFSLLNPKSWLNPQPVLLFECSCRSITQFMLQPIIFIYIILVLQFLFATVDHIKNATPVLQNCVYRLH